MVKSFCFLLILFFAIVGLSAQNSQKIIVEAGNKISDVISFKELYSYPEFTEGNILFKDGTLYKARLNYNLLLVQVQFINPKGDTLTIANEANLQQVSIGSDVFLFNKMYVRIIEDNNNIKLASQKKITIDDSQKIGAFGQPTSGAGIVAINSVVASGQLYNLPLNQRITLSKKETFFLSNSKSDFVVFNKKNLLKLFANHKDEIETYLKEKPVKFNSQDDLIRLTEFVARW